MKKERSIRNVPTESTRHVYGFVESFSKPLEASNYSRLNIVLDAVDAVAFDNGLAADRGIEHLSFVRIMTTFKRLQDAFNVAPDIKEGDWFRATLGVRPGRPRAWVLEAKNDYGETAERINLLALQRMGGSGPGESTARLDNLRAWCKNAANPLPQTVVDLPHQLYVRVLDVGHASCSAIHIERRAISKIVGYFDVGSPIFFHSGTFPKSFKDSTSVPKEGFVALSHWDFDHYSLAVSKVKSLQGLVWYAPDQPVGPNAARLQKLLGRRLHLLDSSTFDISSALKMWRGTGAAGDRNNSGYVLTVENVNGKALLTGDVAYGSIPPGAKAGVTALGITHHGGSGAGSPPAPISFGATAAVSYGIPNHYNHPSSVDIDAHTSVGWRVHPTYVKSNSRGDVWLP